MRSSWRARWCVLVRVEWRRVLLGGVHAWCAYVRVWHTMQVHTRPRTRATTPPQAFAVLLWVVGPSFGVSAVLAAMLGLCVLLCSGTLSWKDCLTYTPAWDTLTWFAGARACMCACVCVCVPAPLQNTPPLPAPPPTHTHLQPPPLPATATTLPPPRPPTTTQC